MRLLLIEDERTLCDAVARRLRRLGYSVDLAYDGEQALQLLEVERYDLVLLDLNLPKLDGMSVLRTLRKTDRETRVLILSARSGTADKVDGLDAGANDYLSKPFALAELEARIRSLTQRQFVGNAAHELRTPLTLLQTQLELFSDEHPDILPESAAFLDTLQDEVQRLSRLTHALLDMSDLQSVPRDDVILLSPMIDEVFADLAPLAERNGISLSREGEDVTVVGSDMLLCRMFFNLVENGVKYNHPGGMVKVDVQQRDGQAVIHVTDTGCGIPQEFWQSIFQPFFRVDKSLSRELGGAGLGLPLVWEIARLHGGRVWVEKSNDSGSVLAVTLPLSAPITDTVRG